MEQDTRIEKAIEDLGGSWPRRLAAGKDLLEIGIPAVPLLIAALRGRRLPWGRSRNAALLVLALLEDPAAIWVICDALPRADILLGPRLVDSLGRMGDLRAAPALRAALRAQHFEIRARAAAALAKLLDREAVPALCAALARHGSYFRRPPREIPLALGELGDPRAVPALLDPAAPFPVDRERALSRLGPIAVPELVAALAPGCGLDRELAVSVLVSLGAGAAGALRSALDDKDRSFAAAAAAVLALTEPPSTDRLALLTQALRDDCGPICWGAALALQKLAAAAPPSALLAVVPLLRQASIRHWTTPPVRDACRKAFEQIEEVAGSFAELPLPSHALAGATGLPLPADGFHTAADRLPLAASCGNRSD